MAEPKRMTGKTDMTVPDLRIENLSIVYSVELGDLSVVRNVSFEVRPGEVVGIVGESGSGKSTLGYSILGALEGNGRISGGRIEFLGRDITDISRSEMAKLRGAQIALVPQDPPTSLNPTVVVGEQIAEVLRHHEGFSQEEAKFRTRLLLSEVNISNPDMVYDRYPFELSGGQQQRIAIAMAFACRPRLLIMDEPTTGLDVTSEARVLELLQRMISEYGTSVLYISHNLGTIVHVCDRVIVMYAGELVEEIAAEALIRHARHPYTINLLNCIPSLGARGPLRTLDGELPNLLTVPRGCVFAPRCPHSADLCRQETPKLEALSDEAAVRCWRHREIAPNSGHSQPAPALISQPNIQAKEVILRVENLASHYDVRRSIVDVLMRRPRKVVKAVDGVSFEIERGSTFAVVGESGCGKTTLGRTLLGLTPATRGKIVYLGKTLPAKLGSRSKSLRRDIQAVFQNPEQTLNPKKMLSKILGRPLALVGRKGSEEAVEELLRRVRIPVDSRTKFPRQLSGGQKQRVAIARAFATSPKFIVCDEPLSALDVSVQAAIINLLKDLQRQQNTTYVFISHDLPLVAYLADKIAVMYLGKICEIGSAEQVLRPPYHPYTEALLGSVPLVDASITQRRTLLEGAAKLGSGKGCVFAARCPRKIADLCNDKPPPMREFEGGHQIACHIPEGELRDVSPVFDLRQSEDEMIGAGTGQPTHAIVHRDLTA